MSHRTPGLAKIGALALIAAFAAVACAGSSNDDLLAKVKAADKIVMSTDPEYPPQSSLAADGSYEGFDIDVGTEIAKRLGVEIAFETPSWEAITAGSWAGRWDFSVGSMTITTDREKVISFSSPYYYTPAQMAVLPDSGITSLDGLAGKVICVGEGTTYLQWLDGTLDFGTATPQTKPPEGATATTLKSDRNCAESWQAGRRDFDGWLSSVTTVQGAIDAGLPVMKLGDPVFSEPLAVAFDKGGADPASIVTEVNKLLDAMRSDGTLKALSEKWFGEDLTTKVGG
jgi:polar amino acid transport system substrate-binding protein